MFYLTYTPEDVEGNVQLETGDKINFVIDNNKHTGAVSARNIMLLKKKQARYQGVVCAMKVSVIKFDKLEFSLAVLSLSNSSLLIFLSLL